MSFVASRCLVVSLSVIALCAASGCAESSPSATGHAAPSVAADDAAESIVADEIATAVAASAEGDDAPAAAAPAGDETDAQPQRREAAKPVVGEYGADVPPVLLSSGHAKLCKLKVGDEFPALQLQALSGGSGEIAFGSKATVVVFWTTDRWMSGTALRDLAAIEADGLAIVGVAVGATADAAAKMSADAGVKFTQLVDANGAAFAQVGEGALPRLFVLDPQRHVAWFDIEYSEASHRELQQAIATLTQ